MLTVHNIHKKIEGVPVLHNISFSIEPGSIVGLVGRNGAGKTTLLRTLVGILEVDAGEVLFDKQNIMTNPQVKSSIAYIPDNHNAFNSYSVQEASSLYKAIYRDFDEAYFHELLARFQLPAKKSIRNFSKGMKALLFIILSLATNVRLIILDEPTNGLDVIVKKKILQLLLEEVSDRNLSILISSHHLNELEKIVDKVLFMKDGTINKTVSLDEAKQQVKKFQIAFNEDLPEKFLHLPQIEIVSQMGRVYTILIKDNISETLQLIENKNPIFLEELQMSLEDLFVSVVGGKENV